MRRRTILPLLALAGCTLQENPRPGPVRAMPPRPNPPLRPLEAAARPGWSTRFWEELTPAQRRLVAARLRRGPPPQSLTEAEARTAWDVMGLADRDALIRGAGVRASAAQRR